MELKINELESVGRFEAGERLYLNAAGDRLVPADSHDADTLYAIEGDEISHEDAVKYGLVKGQRSATPDDSWKVDELKAYADEHEIDLEGASKKADILAAIESAEAGE